MTAVGWGYTVPGASPTITLQDGLVRVITDGEALEQDPTRVPERFVTVETGSGGATPCQGDSGGPLVQQRPGVDIQFGVMNAADCTTGAVYAEVYQGELRDWVNSQVPRPASDLFDNAEVLSGTGGMRFGTTTDATTQITESTTHETSVWYRWTAPESGPARITVGAHDFDSTVGVYVGDHPGFLTEIAFDDDTNFSMESSVTFQATAGTTYRIAVDGHEFSFGDFVLSYGMNRPANDDFANAEVIEGAVGRVVAANNSQRDRRGRRTPQPDAERLGVVRLDGTVIRFDAVLDAWQRLLHRALCVHG